MLVMLETVCYFRPMIAKTISFMPLGFNAELIEVEGATTQGLPVFNIVGMGARTVSEARDRVRSAIKNSGFLFPDNKLTINLAPADLEKEGTFFDLPIAINVLMLSKQLLLKNIEDMAFVGELSLDGSLRPVRGIINIVETAKKHDIHTLFIPEKNFEQASIITGINLIPIKNLTEIFRYLRGQTPISKKSCTNGLDQGSKQKITSNTLNFDDIHGQAIAKRALTIAVAGRHNILLSGPPGTGKTMLARAAMSLLPELSTPEKIAITKLHSLTTPTEGIIEQRPFRTPHHTSSLASLIGGGANAEPGEISLAHLGVLFLDELPEYQRLYLEALRQPLEDREITISRARRKVTYPADFMLIATMNPCPCGYLGDKIHPCSCSETQINNYRKKLSGPLLDRIDLFTEVSRPDISELDKKSNTDQQAKIKIAIKNAISIQRERYKNNTVYNSSVPSRNISEVLLLSTNAKTLLNTAAKNLNLSVRSYYKVIKVARTIADLENSREILESHLTEALNFRYKIP